MEPPIKSLERQVVGFSLRVEKNKTCQTVFPPPLTWDKAGLRLTVLKHNEKEITQSDIHARVTLRSKGGTEVKQEPGSRPAALLCISHCLSFFCRGEQQGYRHRHQSCEGKVIFALHQGSSLSAGFRPSTSVTGSVLIFSASSNTLWLNK